MRTPRTAPVFVLFVGILFFSSFPLHAKKRDTLSVSSIQFVENQRQWPDKVLFASQLHGGALFFEKNRIVIALLNSSQLALWQKAKADPSYSPPRHVDAAAYAMRFVNANPQAETAGEGEYPFYHNYYRGNDPSRWASRVKLFEEILYQDLYDGIDLRYYQHGSHVKCDFIVQPGKDPDVIQWEYEGIKSLTLSNQDLLVHTAVGSHVELKPFAYQLLSTGDTLKVPCSYHISKNRVSFTVGDYDKDLPLCIDPVLVFSTLTGSTADNWGFTATYDSYGNTYAGGIAFSVGYPVTLGAYQVDYAGGRVDISISKFSADGSLLLYSTYLGGSGVEAPHSLVVNGNQELHLLGTTGSSDFPITSGAYQTTFQGGDSVIISSDLIFNGGADMVIVKFNSTGSQLLASTFVGGTENDGLNLADPLRKNYADESRGEILVDGRNNIYVVSSTSSSDFPTTGGVFQPAFGGGSQDACLFKMNYTLSNMIWSSFLGGGGDDAGYNIDIAGDRSLYACGGTNSSDFPVTANALQPSRADANFFPDGFVVRVDEHGRQLLAGTFLGDGKYDQAYMLKLDQAGFPHVCGQTYAEGNFWIHNAAWNLPGGGQFISKLDPSLSQFVWSTAFGRGRGTPDLSPSAFLVDVCNRVYLSGWGGGSNNFGGTAGLPVTADAIQLTTDGEDYYMICIAADASSVEYATFFGSPSRGDHVDGGTSRFDRKGTIYQAICAGCGGTQDFPTTPGVWSRVNGSLNCNLAAIKVEFNLHSVLSDFVLPGTVCAPAVIDFENTSLLYANSSHCFWDFGDGTTSTLFSPTHEYETPGTYTVQLIVEDPTSCNGTDTLSKQIVVLGNGLDTLPPILVCDSLPVQIGLPPSADIGLTYRWEPVEGLSNPAISNPIATIAESTIYTLHISNGTCFDTLVYPIQWVEIGFTLPGDTVLCPGDSLVIDPVVLAGNGYYFHWSTSPAFDVILNGDTSIPTLTVSPRATTTYYFKMGKGSACFSTDHITIRVSPLSLSLPDTVRVCPGENLVIEALYTCGECLFHWTPSDGIISGSHTGTITVPPVPETYILEIVDGEGCRLLDTTSVTPFPDLFPYGFEAWVDDNSIVQGDTISLTSTLYSGEFTYRWTPSQGVFHPDAFTTLARPHQSTVFLSTVTDGNGCQRSDTVFVFVEELLCRYPYVFVPNAFTPNHDGINDVLYVRSHIVDYLLFRIYDRWGEKIFESMSLDEGWDGTWKGKDAPSGVYDYYLEARCLGGRTYITKGNVTLIR